MRLTRFALRLLTSIALVVTAVCAFRLPLARPTNPTFSPDAPPSPVEGVAPTPKPFQEIYGIDPARMLLYHQKELRMPEDERGMREMREQMRKTFEAVPSRPEKIR
jgi:hypothetical protein